MLICLKCEVHFLAFFFARYFFTYRVHFLLHTPLGKPWQTFESFLTPRRMANFCLVPSKVLQHALPPPVLKGTIAFAKALSYAEKAAKKNTIQKRHPNQYPLTRNNFFAKHPPPISWPNELGRKVFDFPLFCPVADVSTNTIRQGEKAFPGLPSNHVISFFFPFHVFFFFSPNTR